MMTCRTRSRLKVWIHSRFQRVTYFVLHSDIFFFSSDSILSWSRVVSVFWVSWYTSSSGCIEPSPGDGKPLWKKGFQWALFVKSNDIRLGFSCDWMFDQIYKVKGQMWRNQDSWNLQAKP